MEVGRVFDAYKPGLVLEIYECIMANFPHFLSLGIVAVGPFSSHFGETYLYTIFLEVVVSAEPSHALALASLWPTSGICLAFSQKAAYGQTSEKN